MGMVDTNIRNIEIDMAPSIQTFTLISTGDRRTQQNGRSAAHEFVYLSVRVAARLVKAAASWSHTGTCATHLCPQATGVNPYREWHRWSRGGQCPADIGRVVAITSMLCTMIVP